MDPCGLQNGFGKRLLLQVFRYVDFENIDRVPHFTGAAHRIDRRQNHSGNGDTLLCVLFLCAGPVRTFTLHLI